MSPRSVYRVRAAFYAVRSGSFILQRFRILAARNQRCDAGLHEGLVVRVSHAEPCAIGLDHRALGLLGLNQSIDHGRDVALRLHFLPVQPPFPRPPVRPDGWLRGLPQKQIPSGFDI